MPGGLPRMPGGLPRMPGGLPRMPGGLPRMPGRLPRMPGGLPRMPGGLPRMPGGVQMMPGGLSRMPGGLLRMLGGVQRMAARVTGMEGGIPGMAGAILRRPDKNTGRPGGVLERSNCVAGTPGLAPGRMVSTSQLGLDGSSEVNTGGENVSRRGSGNMGQYIFSGDTRIKKYTIASKLVTGLASRSSSRGGSYGVNGGSSFTSRGGYKSYKRGGIRMSIGGTASNRGFGMVTRGRPRMSATGAVPKGVTVHSGGRRLVRGGIGTSGGSGIGQVGTIDTARKISGMYTGDVQLTQNVASMARKGGMVMGRGGLKFSGGFKRITEMTRDYTGGVEITKAGKGFTGDKRMTKGIRRFTGRVGEKQGNSVENMTTGEVYQYQKTTPDITTSNRVIEVIDLDQTFDNVEEKPMINNPDVDQKSLSEEDIRDRYYKGVSNFEEKDCDINGNKNGEKLTAVKKDADGSLKLLMKATVNPNITVSIVTEEISLSKNKSQDWEQSVTNDKVRTDNKIREIGKLNTNDINNVDDVEINIKTVDTVSVDDVMEVSDNKIESNLVMFENAVESNASQNDWADIDALKVIIDRAGQKPFNVNEEEILFDFNIDVTEIDKSEYYCREDQKSLEINSEIKGDSENKYVKFVDQKSPKCQNEIVKCKFPDQIEASKTKDKVAIPKRKKSHPGLNRTGAVSKSNKLVVNEKVVNRKGSKFTLVSHNVYPTCSCRGANKVCTSNSCACVRLRQECPAGCGCGETCVNMGLTRGEGKLLRIGASQVHGDGCFTEEDICRGDFVGEYTGKIVLRADQLKKKNPSKYLIEMGHNDILLDAENVGSELSKVNHKTEKEGANCKFQAKGTEGVWRVGVWALKNIKKDDELFANYGYNYRGHGLYTPPRKKSRGGYRKGAHLEKKGKLKNYDKKLKQRPLIENQPVAFTSHVTRMSKSSRTIAKKTPRLVSNKKTPGEITRTDLSKPKSVLGGRSVSVTFTRSSLVIRDLPQPRLLRMDMDNPNKTSQN